MAKGGNILKKFLYASLLISPFLLATKSLSYLEKQQRVYYTHPIGRDKRNKMPSWFKGFVKKSFYDVIKPFNYEPMIENRLNMPKAVKWKLDEKKNYKEIEKERNLIKSSGGDGSIFIYVGYPNLPPPSKLNAGEYIRAHPLVVKTEKHKKGKYPIKWIYVSKGLSVKIADVKDTTIWIRKAGNIDVKKFVILVKYDTLNPWVYYNSPLGLFYRLGWNKSTNIGWSNMIKWKEKYEWFKPISVFSGYVEACIHLQEFFDMKDSLKNSIELIKNLDADSLAKLGIIELPDEVLKGLKIKEIGKKMEEIKYAELYLNEKNCRKYKDKKLYRYFTRGGFISLVIEGKHKEMNKLLGDYNINVNYYEPIYAVWEEKFLKRWNEETYWDSSGVIIEPDYVGEDTDYELKKNYGGVILHYISTSPTSVDTLVLYFAAIEKYKNMLENVQKYPLILNK